MGTIHKLPEQECSGCGAELGRRNKTGRCRACHWRWFNAQPEWLANRAEKLRDILGSPDMNALVIKQRTVASRSRLAWCPLEYRDEYRRLTRSKKALASEARQMIKDLIAADYRAYQQNGCLPQMARAA